MGWLDSVISVGSDLLKSNAGKIASGVAGAVLGSGDKKTTGSSTDTTKSGSTITQLPPWMNDYAQQLLTQQNNLSNQGYRAYEGAQVADLTPDQQNAANMVRGNAGQAGEVIADAMGNYNPNAGRGMLSQASQYVSGAGGSWLDPNVSTNFMSDYQSNVTNPAVSQAMRTWNEQINPSIQADFAGSKGVGAFGSDAMLRHTQAAGTNLTEKLGENMAQYLDKGYTQGMGQFNQENQQKGQLATIAGNLGRTDADMAGNALGNQIKGAEAWQSSNVADASALSEVGGQQQAVDQAKLDAAKGNWDDANAWSQNQINTGAGLLGQLGNSVNKTVSETGATSNNQANTKHVDPITGAIQGMESGNQIQEILDGLLKSGGSGQSSPKANPAEQMMEQQGGMTGSLFKRGGRVPGGMLKRLAESDRRARRVH